MPAHQVTLEQAEYIAYRLAREMMEYDEPIADFATRYPHKLESCLEQPFVTFGGKELYPTLVDKAAMLFYLVIKNHPFENGNKRMAVMLMLYFLYINDKFSSIDHNALYELALIVAQSSTPIHDYLPMLKQTLSKFIVEAPL